MFSFSKLAVAALLSFGAVACASPIAQVGTPGAAGALAGATKSDAAGAAAGAIAPGTVFGRGAGVIAGAAVGAKVGDTSVGVGAVVGAKVGKRDIAVPTLPQICYTLRDKVNPLLATVDATLSSVQVSGTVLAGVFVDINAELNIALTAVHGLAGLSIEDILTDVDHVVDQTEVAQVLAAVIVDVKARADAVLASGCEDLAVVSVVIATVNGTITSLLCTVGTLVAGLLKLIAPLLGAAICFIDSIRALGLLNLLL